MKSPDPSNELWRGQQSIIAIWPGQKIDESARPFQKRTGETGEKLCNLHEKISDERGPNLHFDCVIAVAEEVLDLQVLLDPLEEGFDLPTMAIQRGDRAWRQVETVGQKMVDATLLIAEDDKAQKFFHSLFSLADSDDLVSHDATVFLPLRNFSTLHDSVSPDALPTCNEIGVRIDDALEQLKVEIASVKNIHQTLTNGELDGFIGVVNIGRCHF